MKTITTRIQIVALVTAGFLTIPAVHAQSPNIDFETGTFSGWQGETGYCCPITTSPSGIVVGQHTILTGSGYDTNALDSISGAAEIPFVYPLSGNMYSVRLGNSLVGAQAEQLSYSYTVTPSDTVLTYHYAVVLQSGGHPPSAESRFEVHFYDALGGSIPGGDYITHGGYDPTLKSSQISSWIKYKTWTTTSVNLASYVGQTITIKFVVFKFHLITLIFFQFHHAMGTFWALKNFKKF